MLYIVSVYIAGGCGWIRRRRHASSVLFSIVVVCSMYCFVWKFGLGSVRSLRRMNESTYKVVQTIGVCVCVCVIVKCGRKISSCTGREREKEREREKT